MIEKIPKYPIPTYLEWADACANAGWFGQGEATRWAERDEWIVRELGWIVKETREYVLFAGRWMPPCSYSYEQFGNLQKIPKTWIRKRKVVNVR